MLTKVAQLLQVYYHAILTGKTLLPLLCGCLALNICNMAEADPVQKKTTEPVFNSQIYLEEYGKQNDISLVLVHGSGDLAANIWRPVVADLKDSFHVITFDLPGFGRSEKKNELYSPARYARLLNWIIKQHASDPVYLVGHSLGGAIALYYAGMYPADLERLILVDTAGILHRSAFTKSMISSQLDGEVKLGGKNLIEKPLSALKTILNTAIENIDKRLAPEKIGPLLESETFRKTALAGDPARISGMALIHTDFGPVIDQVKAPTVIVWGERDSVTPLRTGKLLAYRIKHSSLIVLNGLKHNPMLEDSETFNSILLQSIMDPAITPFTKIDSRNALPKKRSHRLITGQTNLKVTGSFDSLKIKNSRGILISDLIARSIDIDNSEVSIENTRVESSAIGINLVDSIVYLTGTHISAKTAIKVNNSSVDLAGSILRARRNLITSERKSTIVFSVCTVDSPSQKGYVHKVIRLLPGDSF